MEKVIYVLSWPDGERPGSVGETLRGPVAAELRALGGHHVTVNVVDHHVEPAAGLRMISTDAPAEALVSVWLDSANDPLRAPFDAVVASVGARTATYLVTESVPLVHRAEGADGRVDGMAQVVFLCRREGQSTEEWLDIWLTSHTQIAIDTQDTFSYVQNVVTRVLTPGAPAWDAIVEECFPAAAMTDPAVFFDAVGDDERLARHRQEMFASVQRFIDLARIEVIPTSRYDVA
jgi:hypothetical protein